MDIENNNNTRNAKLGIICSILGILLPLLVLLVCGLAHNNKIQELQMIENEINQAITAEEYDTALMLANQLYCDGNWSPDENIIWDEKRENYIDMIWSLKRESESETNDYILAPSSSDKLVGKNYSKVSEMFAEAGFTNISTRATPKEAEWYNFNETVEHITVGGKSDFTKEETFDKDAAVVIYYYSK